MSLRAEDVDACEACRNGDHGKCPDPDGCGCEFMEDTPHSGDAIQSLRTQLAEATREVKALEEDRDKWKSRAYTFVGHIETLQRKIDKRATKIETAALALRKKILRPNGNLIFDTDAIEAFFDGLPKE